MPKGKKKPTSYGGNGSDDGSDKSSDYHSLGSNLSLLFQTPPTSSPGTPTGSWSYHTGHEGDASSISERSSTNSSDHYIRISERSQNKMSYYISRAILIPGIIIAGIIGIFYATSKKIVLSNVYIGIIVGIFTWLLGWGKDITFMISHAYEIRVYNHIAIAVGLIALGTICGVIFTLSTGSKKWIDGILLMNVGILGFVYVFILGNLIFYKQ